MSERVRITVKGSRGDDLTVEDAMQQILDFFKLLSLSSNEPQTVEWRLVYASANSPLTVEAEAFGSAPDAEVKVIARSQKIAFSESFRAALRGERPPMWEAPERNAYAASLMRRTLNGISETAIDFESSDAPPLSWTNEAARAVIETLEHKPAFEHDFRQHTERGVIEGLLSSSDPYYGRPAIWVQDRRGTNIPCRISDDLQRQITIDLNFDDVWHKRRVAAKGRVYYSNTGRITRVDADSVVLLGPSREVSLEKLLDVDFTDGLTPTEYLDRLQDGDLE